MLLIREPINKWFGYTRRERRSASILLVIIIIIIVIRYVVPERNIDIKNINTGLSVIDSISGIYEPDTTSNAILFAFDPNSASYDTLIKLGFASKEANTLIRYRSKGGKFRNPSDIRKVYGVDSVKAEKLVPYIVLSGHASEKAVVKVLLQEKPLLNINNCDSLSLLALPGIGPVLSARIIKYRNLLGGFAHVEQLREVYGLPEETYEIVKGRLFADSSDVRKININSAGYKELSRIPYLEKYEVTAILKYRELNGRIKGAGDLTENKLLSSEKAIKACPYMSFE
jgi:DNA uptake protein ComE-like DNA-binding protein